MITGVYNYFNIFILHFNFSLEHYVVITDKITNMKDLQAFAISCLWIVVLFWGLFVIVLRDI